MVSQLKNLVSCLAIFLLLTGASFAEVKPPPETDERGSGYKKVTVTCLDPDGQPISPCDIEFKPNVSVAGACMGGSCRCITKPSGICQIFLRCCGHQGTPPIMWNVKATSRYGEKKTYFWTNCGWTCDESKYLRFGFKDGRAPNPN
jgi:hypothetical protein